MMFPPDVPPKASGVYVITCLRNGKCYVGSAMNLRNRFNAHIGDLRQARHRGPRFRHALMKHGLDWFLYEVLELVADKALLIEREQLHIDLLGSAGEWGYNTAPRAGSMAGFKHSDTSRARMSVTRKALGMPKAFAIGCEVWTGSKHTEASKAAMRAKALGRVVSQATRNKLSLLGMGRANPCSAETRAKLSAAMTGRTMVVSEEGRAAKAAATRKAWTGRKHSEATRAKLSAGKVGKALPAAMHEAALLANIGRSTPWSPATRAKVSARMKGQPLPPEVTEAARKVNTGKKWTSEQTARRVAAYRVTVAARKAKQAELEI